MGRDACTVPVKPNRDYLKCGACKQNALPAVNVGTMVYSNSDTINYCRPALAAYLDKFTGSGQASGSGNDQCGTGVVSNHTNVTMASCSTSSSTSPSTSSSASSTASPSTSSSASSTASPSTNSSASTSTSSSTSSSASSSTNFSASSANGASSWGSGDNIPDLPTLVRQGLKRRHKDLQAGIQEPLPIQACVVGDQDMLEEIARQAPDTVCHRQQAVIYREPVPLALVAAEHNHETCVKKLALDSQDMFHLSVELALKEKDHSTLATLVRCVDFRLTKLYLVEAIERKDMQKAQLLLVAGVDLHPAAKDVVKNYRSPETISFLNSLGVSGSEIVLLAAQAENRRLFEDLQVLPELRRIIGHAHYVEAIILAAQQDDLVTVQALKDVVTLEDALCVCVGEQNEAAIAALIKSGACFADALSLAVSDGQQEVFEQLLIRNADDCGHYLRLAAQNGDKALVQALLNAGIDANGGDDHADTPLAFAARNSHAAVVNLLYEALGPDRRVSVIAQAARGGTETELRSLLATCTDAGQMFRETQRVINYVLDHPDYGEPVIRQLLDKMDASKTAMILSEALKNNDDKMLATLLAAGADANATDRNGWPLLHKAANSGDLQMVQLLLEKGATADLQSPDGKTALFIAVGKGHKSVANRLIKATGGVDIETEVAAAVGREDVEMLRHLLCMADLGGNRFRQLFHQAAVSKQSQVVSVFAMQKTISVQIAFAMALDNNELAVVIEFLNAGIDNSRCWLASGLLMAAVRQEEEKVKTLIQHGVDPRNDIKFAAQARETEALSVLLSAVDDIEARNRLVEALIFSEDRDPSVFSSLVGVERDSGAAGLRGILFSILAKSKQARTALESALATRQNIMDRNRWEYLQYSPAINRQGNSQWDSDDEEEPPIHRSVMMQSCNDATIEDHLANLEKNEAVIQALIRAGADLDITDDNGVSFLSQAIQGNCHDIVRSILDCWRDAGPALNNPAAPGQQSEDDINRDLSRTLTDALVLAIGLDRQEIATLLLDALHGMKNAEFDRSRLNGNSSLLYSVAKTGNIRLLAELWQQGARATPSLGHIVQDANVNMLQRFVDAGIKLDTADVGSEVHPLLLAATLYAGSDNLQVVRSMVSITDNVEDVICNQALTTQKIVLSKLWQVVAEQYERIMNILVRAADGENHRLFETLAGDGEMVGQLGRCLSDAAHHGHRKVVSELINIDVDINSDPAVFLYDIALEHPDIAKMVVDYWQGKANRNPPVIIRAAVNLAKQKMEQPNADRQQTEQICASLNGLLGSNAVPAQSTDLQNQQSVRSQLGRL
nr:ankyrin repeat domain-containing protein [Endozoicomonas sp. YOMI1]